MKKILLAYDGGEPARRALDLTADLADFDPSSTAIAIAPGGVSPSAS